MSNNNSYDFQKHLKNAGMLVVGVGAVGAGVFLALRYRVANPNEFIAKTGLGIRGIDLSKKTMQWPFQTAIKYDVNPFPHNFDLRCMSKEMIEMRLPIAFTLQPIIPTSDVSGAQNYARRMLGISQSDAEATISNVLEGTTRTLSGQLTIDKLFNERDAFRDDVVAGVQAELNEIGLEIVSANIQEMGDYDEHNKYFEYRKKRATETANHQARVDVAEAKMTGEIGVAEREGKTRIQTAAIERDATIAENERNQSIAKSDAELQVIQAEADRNSNKARVEAEILVDMRRAEMEKELEQKRCEREIESERANKLAPTIVNKEKIETDAQAYLYKEQRNADAKAYNVEKTAEARLVEAQREAEATIARNTAEAKGILAIKEAEAEGLRLILDASQENPTLTQFYLGLNRDLPQKVVEEQAKALQGLNPNVNIWNTGGSADGNPVTDTFGDMASKLVAGLDMVKDKVDIPSYLPQIKKLSYDPETQQTKETTCDLNAHSPEMKKILKDLLVVEEVAPVTFASTGQKKNNPKTTTK